MVINGEITTLDWLNLLTGKVQFRQLLHTKTTD